MALFGDQPTPIYKGQKLSKTAADFACDRYIYIVYFICICIFYSLTTVDKQQNANKKKHQAMQL